MMVNVESIYEVLRPLKYRYVSDVAAYSVGRSYADVSASLPVTRCALIVTHTFFRGWLPRFLVERR